MTAVAVYNAQRKVRVDRAQLERFANAALQLVSNTKSPARGTLGEHEVVNVVLVTDRKIAALHKRFMNVAGPTDVITFHEGEIVISTETARRQAKTFGTSTVDELKLYILHGLLHLHGFDDRTAAAAKRMRGVQSRLLRRLRGRGAG